MPKSHIALWRLRASGCSCGLRILACASIFLAAGCQTTIDRPTTLTADKREAGITYHDAEDYLIKAQTSLQAQAKLNDQIDTTTRVGVGGGVAAAGVSAVFRGAVNPILGLLSFSSLNYAANQEIGPRLMARIYTTGVDNLDCIDSAAAAAMQSYRAYSPALTPIAAQLTADIGALQADVDSTASARPDLTGPANTQLAAARAVQTKLNAFLNPSAVAQLMVTGTNQTIDAVNDQIRLNAPDLNAIAQSGSVIGLFLTNGASLRSQTQTAIAQFNAAPGVGKANGDTLADTFAGHEAAIAKDLKDIPTGVNLDSAPNTVAMGQCQTRTLTNPPVTVSPSGPIAIKAGQTISLAATGSGPFRVMWIGAVPSDVTVSVPSPDQVVLIAATGAQSNGYTFRVADMRGQSTADTALTVGIGATPAQQGGGGSPNPPAPPTADIQTALMQSHTISDLDKLMGLNPASVTSTSQSDWATRVEALKVCAKRTDTANPYLDQSMYGWLSAHQPIDANGDCPT